MNNVQVPEAKVKVKKKRRTKQKIHWKENLAAYLFLAPALVILSIFLIIPTLRTIFYAFTDFFLLRPDEITFIGLDNFVRLFQDELFFRSLMNTLRFVVYIIPIQLGAALGLALLLNKQRKGNLFFKVAIFSPVVVSLAVVSVLWINLLNPNSGLINSFLSIFGIPAQPFLTSPNQALFAIVAVSAWQGAGFQMLIFLAGLQNIPRDVYEAAYIEGITKWKRFFYITLPLLRPTSIFIFTTTLIAAFGLLVQPMIMTQGGPLNSTITVMFYMYRTGFTDRHVGYASAMALMYGLIVGLVTFVQRQLVKEEV